MNKKMKAFSKSYILVLFLAVCALTNLACAETATKQSPQAPSKKQSTSNSSTWKEVANWGDSSSIQIPRPVQCNVFGLGEPVVFKVHYKAKAQGTGTLNAYLVDYFGVKTQAASQNFSAKAGEKVVLSVDLSEIDPGFYRLLVAIDQGGKRFENKAQFGITEFVDRTLEEVREAGYRFGMKMWGPTPYFDSFAAMDVCSKLGLHWTRELFTRSVDELNKLPFNIIMKVEMFPPEAYDAERYGPMEEYKRRKHGWQKTTLPLEKPYKKWLREKIRELPEEQNIFEVWNEPWGKMPPEDFAKLLQYAVDVILEERPDAIIGPNLGHLEYDLGVIEAGGFKGCKALFLHPYASPEGSEKRKKLRHIREFYDEHLGRHLDFYVTEHGSPSPPAGPRKNSEERAALRAVRDSLAFYAEGIKSFTPHVLGQTENKPDQKEHWYGYFRRNMEPKPGLIALAVCADRIDGSRYVGDLFYQHDVGTMLFEKDGKMTQVLWTNDLDLTVEVETGVEEVTLVNFMGGESRLPTPGGKIMMDLTGVPVYMVGVSPELENKATTDLSMDRWQHNIFKRGSRTARKMQSPPKIDGKITEAEWGGHTTIEMVCGKADPKDSSALGYVAWDEDRLYVAADVTDDEPYFNNFKPAEVYAGDSLEVWVGSQPKYQIPEFVHTHDAHMFFAPTSITGEPVAGKIEVANISLSEIEGLDIAYARTDKGWAVEMAIPLAYFKEFPGKVGHRASFEMRVNDADKKHLRFKANPVDGMPSHVDATKWSYLILEE